MSRGAGVNIAMVDTGICGTMPEFAGAKKSQFRWPVSSTGQADPWTDQVGHGSMTGAIAAGTTASGGRYNGVAPDSPIIACKSSFDDTELYQIYDYLIQLVDSQKIRRLVVNNSYGSYVCAAPSVTRGDPFPSIVALAVSKGIVVVFAAGNNHVVVCGNDPTQCSPNTIWGTNSMDEVLSVGTVNREIAWINRLLHGRVYSSRQQPRPRTIGGDFHKTGLCRSDLWRSYVGLWLFAHGMVGHQRCCTTGSGAGRPYVGEESRADTSPNSDYNKTELCEHRPRSNLRGCWIN